MHPQNHQSVSGRQVWALARRQHGVITRGQLLGLGLGTDAIKHRVATGRLHSVHRGVYALGRPELTREGLWMAAVLSCGPDAVLSHRSAAALWEIRAHRSGPIEVSVPAGSTRRRRGVIVHRRTAFAANDCTRRRGIPVTTPVCTLVDLAAVLDRGRLEAAVNEADKRGLTDPEALRAALDAMARRPGVAALRGLLDRSTFTLTDSELERRFLRIARGAGLGLPRTGQRLNGFKVDFHWPEIGLVVETDGLRYHRTPAQQARDRIRDQAHAAAGLTALRFTHAQVRYEPDRVRATLDAVANRLRRARDDGSQSLLGAPDIR
jgi:very-short-patch-repair endonuclease